MSIALLIAFDQLHLSAAKTACFPDDLFGLTHNTATEETECRFIKLSIEYAVTVHFP